MQNKSVPPKYISKYVPHEISCHTPGNTHYVSYLSCC